MSNSDCITGDDGTEYWYYGADLHRLDGPAIKYPNGEEIWYHNGLIHRDNGPAITRQDGSKVWYLDGKPVPIVLCRVGNQSVVFFDGFTYIDLNPYPSAKFVPELRGYIFDKTDLSLFMLTYNAVEMPYE